MWKLTFADQPQMVFVVCNQFPIIAMRYNDARHGTNTVDAVLEEYQAAWKRKAEEGKGGLAGPSGLFPDAWMEKQDRMRPASDPAFTAWGCAYMNSWDSAFVRGLYEKQTTGYLTTINGETRLHPPAVGNAFRSLVEEDGAARDSADTLAKAKKAAKDVAKSRFPYSKPTLGYVAEWLSELGKKEELDSLLQFTDDHLNPTWENGGLYYPRHDEPFNEQLEHTHMDPFTGNGAIGYARLNVEDGQKKMWEKPWTSETLRQRPYVDGVTLADGVDFLRATWDEEQRRLILTMRSWDSAVRKIGPVFKNLPAGKWTLHSLPSRQKTSFECAQGGEVGVGVDVGAEEVDLMLVAS